MDSERWRQIEELYHRALERAPDERVAFVAKACRGDAGLQQEVESLLERVEQARTFLETSALAATNALLTTGAARGPHGQGVQRSRRPARPNGRDQDSQRALQQTRTRSTRGFCVESPQHRHA